MSDFKAGWCAFWDVFRVGRSLPYVMGFFVGVVVWGLVTDAIIHLVRWAL